MSIHFSNAVQVLREDCFKEHCNGWVDFVSADLIRLQILKLIARPFDEDMIKMQSDLCDFKRLIQLVFNIKW